jgi:anti-sigma factor RsiW
LGRPFDKHIDNQELHSLIPWLSEARQERRELPADEVREAKLHVRCCVDCYRKVSKYRRLVNGFSNGTLPEIAPPGHDCPKDDEVDWHEVAAGQWPELKATQLIMHAALCNHCGPQIRRAVSVGEDRVLKGERLREPLWSNGAVPLALAQRRWVLVKWVIPVAALVLIAGVSGTIRLSSRTLSGPKFAEFAVNMHRQHTKGNLALDVLSDSQQTLNEWFQAKLQYALSLPTSPTVPGEERPYRLEGARIVPVGGTKATYISYRMQKGATSLMVIPDSVAVASGGVEANFKKVSFHYAMIDGYKVVTWSVHGLTYALVSDEGNDTQRSCMVCHSAMRDRDLSHTPTPLYAQRSSVAPFLQLLTQTD